MSGRPRDASQNPTLPTCFEIGSSETGTETKLPTFITAQAGLGKPFQNVSETVVSENAGRRLSWNLRPASLNF
jgi:hypothetical protein